MTFIEITLLRLFFTAIVDLYIVLIVNNDIVLEKKPTIDAEQNTACMLI